MIGIRIPDLPSSRRFLGAMLTLLALGASPATTFAASVTLIWGTASGADGYRVFYGKTSGTYQNILDAGNKTDATVTDLTAGARYYFAVKSYAGSRTSAYSKEVSAVVGALVAAYGFEEGSGNKALDSSPKANHGTILNASRTPGKFGGALFFNGTNSLVTVPDTNSLDLTKAMTLSAWVYPTNWASGWKSVIAKERSGGLAYALHANSSVNTPNNVVHIGTSYRNLSKGSQLPTKKWTHLAATYNGAIQRLFVNGAQVGSRNQSGSITLTANPLRIGGNTALTGRYFTGKIDEVRVYNRALNGAEIAAMSKQPVVN